MGTLLGGALSALDAFVGTLMGGALGTLDASVGTLVGGALGTLEVQFDNDDDDGCVAQCVSWGAVEGANEDDRGDGDEGICGAPAGAGGGVGS